MAKIGTWSTTAGNNNATPPDGWPEGQAPSTVNDCAREMMAQIKVYINDAQYVDLGNTPSFLTATTFSMATADVANFEVGRRVKLFDTTTLYGTINSVSATFVSVRLDSGILSTSLSSIAVAVVKQSNNSLPDNIWRRKNLIINGQMDIWQRSATFSPANNALVYTADRFAYAQSAASAVNISRSERSANASNVPSLAQSGVFFNNALLISVSAVDAAIGAAEYALLEYRVEGYDWRQIAHKPMNLSFWANTNKSGIYAVSFHNASLSVSYVQNFTISATSTWTHFSIPVPEAPTTPYTWDYSAGIGLNIFWALAAGANSQGGAGNWTATSIFTTASQVNFLSSAGNTFAITGVQLEEGNFSTPLEIRPYQQELNLCKRYLQVLDSGERAYGFAVANNQAIVNYPLINSMRPGNISLSTNALTSLFITQGDGTAKSVSALTALNYTSQQLQFLVNPVGTPLTLGQGTTFGVSIGATDKIIIKAEL